VDAIHYSDTNGWCCSGRNVIGWWLMPQSWLLSYFSLLVPLFLSCLDKTSCFQEVFTPISSPLLQSTQLGQWRIFILCKYLAVKGNVTVRLKRARCVAWS
jgi:hypothetical protein